MMMDLIMTAILAGSFGLVKVFIDFCEHQIEAREQK